MKNKKVILSSILSLVLCLSLIAGGTFALFTSTTKTNIAITSGNVEVVAWLDDIETFTFGTVQAENTFELGGSATYDATTNKLTVDKIAPGDRVDLNVYIENKSNISVSYRVKVDFAGELQDALVANITLPDDETATVLTAAEVATDWNSFDETNKVVLPMSVELPYGVGNDYMNKSAEIIVTVEAVQGNATELVMIENTRYATFAEALAAANTDDTIVISGVAEYDFGTESNQIVDAKSVTVSGMDGASLVFSGDGANNTFSNVKLENLTVVDTTTSYAESSWEFGYLELADITATNVVFANGIMLDGTNSFTACTFTGKTESGMNMYGAWVEGGTATFTGCTFVGTRGLKACEYYSGDDVDAVTVDGCTFDNLTQKPGIAIDVEEGTITIKNSKFINCAAGELNNYMYENDHNTVTIVSEGNTVSAAVSDQAALNNVLTTAGVDTIEVTLADGTYSFTQVKIWNKNVTFIGTENAVFDMTAQQGVNLVQDMLNTTLTFDGVTVKWSGQDGGYQGIKNPKKVVYKNCNLEGLQYLYGDTDFIGCTLTHREGWAAVAYNSSNVTFTDCTFNTGNHAFLLYTDWTEAGLVFNATLTNCTFNNDGSQVEQWGSEQLVECGDNPGHNIKYNLVLNNCTIIGEGTKALWGNKNSMPADRLTITVDGVAQDVSNHPTANE